LGLECVPGEKILPNTGGRGGGENGLAPSEWKREGKYRNVHLGWIRMVPSIAIIRKRGEHTYKKLRKRNRHGTRWQKKGEDIFL